MVGSLFGACDHWTLSTPKQPSGYPQWPHALGFVLRARMDPVSPPQNPLHENRSALRPAPVRAAPELPQHRRRCRRSGKRPATPCARHGLGAAVQPAHALRRWQPRVLARPGEHHANLRTGRRGSPVRVLEREEWRHGGVRFLACTLWSDYRLFDSPEQREEACRGAGVRARLQPHRPDPGFPGPFYAGTASQMLFDQSVAWLEARFAEPFDGPTVVVVHFAPSPAALPRNLSAHR